MTGPDAGGAAPPGSRAPGWVRWALVLACLLPRLPGLGLPLLEEGHAWRQSVTAMIARNFARHGHRLAWPEIDLPAHAGAVDAPGYTNSEFPLYPWLVSLAYRVTGIHEAVGRLVSVLCCVGVGLLLLRVGERLWGGWAGAVAAAFWALNPLAVFFGRTFLPEPLLVLLLVGTIERLLAWYATGRRRDWWLALVLASLATAVKQPALHLVPALAVAGWRAPEPQRRRVPGWLLPLLPVLTCAGWTLWAQWLGAHYVGHFAQGGGSGLINPGLWWSGDQQFYPRFAVAMIVLLGSVTGLPIAALGLGRPRRTEEAVVLAWLGGAVAIVVVANGAAITHYYYLLPSLAAVAVWVGRGAARPRWFLLRWALTLAVLAGPLLVLPFPELGRWYEVRGSEVAVARALRESTPPGALVYTLCYGTQLLYAADRRGDFLLPEAGFLEPKYVEEAARRGFRYVATGRAEVLAEPAGAALRDWLAARRTVAAGPGWWLVDLGAPGR